MPHIDLLELPYFSGIEIGDVVSLIDAMVPRQFAAGANLITEGDPTLPPLFIITKGLVDVTRHDASVSPPQPCLLAQHTGPTLIGEVELFCARPAASTVQAITQVSCFVLERHTFATLMDAKHPALLPFLFHVAQVACDRLVSIDSLFVQALRGRGEPALANITANPVKPQTP